jgi:hypothetical protein
MIRLLTTIAITAILGIPQAHAAVTESQVKSCEASYRDKLKSDKADAPSGYKVNRPRNFRQTFLAECLSK